MNWPNDSDGIVFKKLRENNFDFEKQWTIDFNIDFGHWPLSADELNLIKSNFKNYEIIDSDDESQEEGDYIGYVEVKIIAKLTYDFVVETQNQISNCVKTIDGWCNSWGVLH